MIFHDDTHSGSHAAGHRMFTFNSRCLPVIRFALAPVGRFQQHLFPGRPQRRAAHQLVPLGGDVRGGLDALVVRPRDLVLVIGQHPAKVLRQFVGVETTLVGVA